MRREPITENCICCGFILDEMGECPYCGYNPIIELSGSDPNDETLKADATKWRQQLIDKLSDIKFELNKGGPLSDKGESVELNTIKIKLADGNDCYEKIVWADEDIWQDQEVELDKTIPINYVFDGKEYTADVQIKTIRTDDWWKFGVTLEDNLHLRFFLGTKDNYSQSELVPLKLV